MASSAVARETFLALRREIARIEGRLTNRLEMPADSITTQPSSAFVSGMILRRAGEAQDETTHIATGVERLDAYLGGGLPKAVLTEFYGAETRNAGAVAGFMLSLLSLLLKSLLQADPVLWIGLKDFFRETGRPYAPGLSQGFGLAPESLIFAEVNKVEDALWPAEEAAVISRFAAVILELSGNSARLDLTSTRRLHRRAMLTGRP
ncbi:MAG: hypothetical protein AB7P20_09190, partial [Rhizobiaceae bacterium]